MFLSLDTQFCGISYPISLKLKSYFNKFSLMLHTNKNKKKILYVYLHLVIIYIYRPAKFDEFERKENCLGTDL